MVSVGVGFGLVGVVVIGSICVVAAHLGSVGDTAAWVGAMFTS